jgi:two-component system, LytTR family, sensor kinase
MNIIYRKNNLFWILQIAGWITYGIVFYFIYYSFTKFTADIFRQLLIIVLWMFLLTSALRYIYRKTNYLSRSILSITTIVIICSTIAAVLFVTGDIFFGTLYLKSEYFMKMLKSVKIESIVWSVVQHSIIISSWSGLYFLIKFWQEWENQKERAEKANHLAQSAQLQMLRYQINPHFLFNSLNSIRALISEDKNNAKEMITELAEFLRYSLISKNQSEVALSDELEAVRHYLAIEKKRYEDKLEIFFNIDPLAEDYPVLSFLIHPLVENAIKFGMQTSPLPLKINIIAEVVESDLIISVNNTGCWVEENKINSEKIKTGLDNVIQRLDNAYAGNFGFEIIKKTDEVLIKIQIRNKVEMSNAKTI